MVDNYDIMGGVQVYDGQNSALTNLKESLSLDDHPTATKMNNQVSPVLTTVTIPITTGSKICGVSGKNMADGVAMLVAPSTAGILCQDNSAVTRANFSIYTVQAAPVKTYVTRIVIAATTSAANDTTSFQVLINPKNLGVSTQAANLAKQTLTAYTDNIVVMFPQPILLTEGSGILISCGQTVGALLMITTVFGFTTAN